MEDNLYRSMVAYLRGGGFPDGMSKNEKDSLRRKSKRMLEKDGELLIRDSKTNVLLKVNIVIIWCWL